MGPWCNLVACLAPNQKIGVQILVGLLQWGVAQLGSAEAF